MAGSRIEMSRYMVTPVTLHAIIILFSPMEIVRSRFLGIGVAFLRNPCTVRKTVTIFYRSMSMKALILEEFGDSSKLKFTEVPKPEPAEGEV